VKETQTRQDKQERVQYSLNTKVGKEEESGSCNVVASYDLEIRERIARAGGALRATSYRGTSKAS